MEGKATYRVLGIDPGLNVTGYGCVEFGPGEPVIVEAGALRPDSKATLARRITQLHDDIAEILAEHRVDALAIEKLYSHYAHPQTAVRMAHARGAILLTAEQAGTAVRDVPATRVKKSLTGNGHATKRQIQMAVRSVFGLAEPPRPADVADALAIALCAGRQLQM
ncbi:MAG: crossover junction endodeoxyribonuclease RuvC [Phycisphaerae bacterium]|jgi:crossover junction endodeoxyribonuclease RuvC|nr:crossover junction endodeoxyribonuclease RuvC [Phycisphaerae bacterium]